MALKMNYRRVCRISILLIALVSFFSIQTNAFGENLVSLKLETASVQPGSEVQVPIIVDRNTGLSSLKFLIKYDDSVLTLTNVTFPKNTGTYSSVPQPYGANQIINFVSPYSAFTNTGIYATLIFTVNQDAELNKVSNIIIEHEENDIFDMNFNNVPLVSVNGAIYVSYGSQESIAVLPSKLTIIKEESFMNTSFYYVVLPETTSEIESKAFADCKKLEYIYIPENTTKIAEDAFLNVANLTIYGKDGSYAEFFANTRGYAFQSQ